MISPAFYVLDFERLLLAGNGFYSEGDLPEGVIAEEGYLLDSTMRKILWPDQFLVGSRSDLGDLLCDPVEELSSRRRLALVEAEDEFVEVILEVLVPDGSLVCSEHPPLEQRNRSVDSWKHMLPVLGDGVGLSCYGRILLSHGRS